MFSGWLAPVRDKIPQDLTADEAQTLSQAIMDEALRRLSSFLQGVRQYQNNPFARSSADQVQLVWEKGTTRLLDYAAGSQGEVVLVIPSLVNRFEILDIDHDSSFLRFLADQGFHPLVVDWGEPGEEEKNFSIDDYVAQRLFPVLDVVKEKTGKDQSHLLGYCMGGLFALALALLKADSFKSLSLIATPWDFAAKGVGGVPPYASWMGKLFSQQARGWLTCLEQVGYIPSFLLQNVFITYQPIQILQKYTGFASVSSDENKARRFVLTEDWLNNGVPLALSVAKECLHDWYEKNLTAELKWRVMGKEILPQHIKMPTYILVPENDQIVPPESALPLVSLIPGATLHQPHRGHIGVMCGNAAAQEVWAPLVDWLRQTEKSF